MQRRNAVSLENEGLLTLISYECGLCHGIHNLFKTKIGAVHMQEYPCQILLAGGYLDCHIVPVDHSVWCGMVMS